MKTALSPKVARWRRLVVSLAGIAILGTFAAAVLILMILAARPGPALILLTLACIAAALLATLLLAAGLLGDPSNRELEARLEAIEDRLSRIEAGSVPMSPAPVPPPVAAVAIPGAESTPPQEPAPPAGVPPAPPEIPISAPPPRSAQPAPVPPPFIPTPAAGQTSGTREGWELALGRRWLGRIGAIVLVIAVALFLKLGWDQGWLRPTEAVRVLLGLALGAGLLVLGEITRRRQGYVPQSQALAAAGLGAMILSLWAATTLYHLVSPSAGLAALLLAAAVVAAYAVAVSGEPLAALAVASGFAAPHLIPSSPWDTPAALAIAVVFAAAALAASHHRRWCFLPWVATAGTALVLVPILDTRTGAAFARIAWSAGILTLALVQLAAAALTTRRPSAERSVRSLVAASAVGTFLAWVTGALILNRVSDHATAVWSVLILFLLATTAAATRTTPGRGTFASALGLLAWLPAVTLPGLLLDGTAVGLAWAAMALAAGIAGLRLRSGGWLLAAASLSVLAAIQPFVASEGSSAAGAIRVLGLTVCLTALHAIVERTGEGAHSRALGILRTLAGPAAAFAAAALAATAASPLTAAIGGRAAAGTVELLIRLTILLAGGVVLALLSSGSASLATRAASATLLAAGLIPQGGPPRDLLPAALLPAIRILEAGAGVLLLAFAAVRDGGTAWRRWFAAVLAGGSSLLAFLIARSFWLERQTPLASVFHPILIAAAGLLILAAERPARRWRPQGALAGWIGNAGWFILVMAASRATTLVVRSGPVISILWGLSGLALLGLGLATRFPARRHLGLILLGLTVGRIFLVDLAGSSTLVRVLAFAITGLVLIAGSFLYARFREMFDREGETGAPGDDRDLESW